MDDRTLKKLRAAAAYERRTAVDAAAAVERTTTKVERARADLAAAEDALRQAQQDADTAEQRAENAAAALQEASPGATPLESIVPGVVAAADTAAARGH